MDLAFAADAMVAVNVVRSETAKDDIISEPTQGDHPRVAGFLTFHPKAVGAGFADHHHICGDRCRNTKTVIARTTPEFDFTDRIVTASGVDHERVISITTLDANIHRTRRWKRTAFVVTFQVDLDEIIA